MTAMAWALLTALGGGVVGWVVHIVLDLVGDEPGEW